MPANSTAMTNFRENVVRIIAETDGLSVKRLAEMLTSRRKKKEPSVSRTFLSNLLHGHFDCSIPFAEEIAAALDVPLSTLLDAPHHLRQTA